MAILRCFLKGCIFELWFPAWNSNQRKRKNPAKVPGVLRAGCEVQVYWTLMCEVRGLDDSVHWDMNLNQQQKASHKTVMNAKKSWNGSWIKWFIFQCQHQLDFFYTKIRHCILFWCLHSWSQLFLGYGWSSGMSTCWWSCYDTPENSEDHPSQGFKLRKVFKKKLKLRLGDVFFVIGADKETPIIPKILPQYFNPLFMAIFHDDSHHT